MTTPEGSITFDLTGLTAGDYGAYFYCCDGFDNLLYGTTFTIFTPMAPAIGPVGDLVENQPLTFQFTGGTGDLTDWVGIYPHDTVPDGDPTSLAFLYVNGLNGQVTFDPIAGLVAGEYYDAHLFCCDGYTPLASFTNFTLLVTGTEESQAVKTPLFTVQPSPAREVVHLVFAKPVNGNIVFFNLMGQIVRSLAVQGASDLEVRGLAPGAYAARLVGPDGVQVVKLVVE